MVIIIMLELKWSGDWFACLLGLPAQYPTVEGFLVLPSMARGSTWPHKWVDFVSVHGHGEVS